MLNRVKLTPNIKERFIFRCLCVRLCVNIFSCRHLYSSKGKLFTISKCYKRLVSWVLSAGSQSLPDFLNCLSRDFTKTNLLNYNAIFLLSLKLKVFESAMNSKDQKERLTNLPLHRFYFGEVTWQAFLLEHNNQFTKSCNFRCLKNIYYQEFTVIHNPLQISIITWSVIYWHFTCNYWYSIFIAIVSWLFLDDLLRSYLFEPFHID